jgi:hypothetical protein
LGQVFNLLPILAAQTNRNDARYTTEMMAIARMSCSPECALSGEGEFVEGTFRRVSTPRSRLCVAVDRQLRQLCKASRIDEEKRAKDCEQAYHSEKASSEKRKAQPGE